VCASQLKICAQFCRRQPLLPECDENDRRDQTQDEYSTSSRAIITRRHCVIRFSGSHQVLQSDFHPAWVRRQR
jgi:hypothetical protein